MSKERSSVNFKEQNFQGTNQGRQNSMGKCE